MYQTDSKYIKLVRNGTTLRLRKSLFWDVQAETLDPVKNKRLILERVFTRGNIHEFRDIQMSYSLREIKNVVVQLATLDAKTLNFLAKTYNIPISQFKCYKKLQ